MRRINNTDRAALVTRRGTFFERWHRSGLDQRQFISRYKKEIDRALVSEPALLGSPPSSAKPPTSSERKHRVLEALNRIEEATETCKLIPTKKSKQEADRAMRDFSRLWFDVKVMVAKRSDATGSILLRRIPTEKPDGQYHVRKGRVSAGRRADADRERQARNGVGCQQGGN